MNVLDEYSKCRFCRSYDDYDGCTEWFCSDKNYYRPDKNRIIAKAKEEGISVADVIALINM